MPISLDKQASYEELWFATAPTSPPAWILLFTARWCAPCHRLDKAAIESVAATRGLPLYICDAAVNKYTPVFCDITRFPTFQIMTPGRVVSSLTSSDTTAVINWLEAVTL